MTENVVAARDPIRVHGFEELAGALKEASKLEVPARARPARASRRKAKKVTVAPKSSETVSETTIETADSDFEFATLKWFGDKGFGFVTLERGDDAFLHGDVLREAKIIILMPGVRVRVKVGPGKKEGTLQVLEIALLPWKNF